VMRTGLGFVRSQAQLAIVRGNLLHLSAMSASCLTYEEVANRGVTNN